LPVDTCHRLGAGNAEGASHLLGDAPGRRQGPDGRQRRETRRAS
jgi:hypothetical protein